MWAYSEVREDVFSEEEARTELFYASAKGSEYIAPPVENPIPSLFLLLVSLVV